MPGVGDLPVAVLGADGQADRTLAGRFTSEASATDGNRYAFSALGSLGLDEIGGISLDRACD